MLSSLPAPQTHLRRLDAVAAPLSFAATITCIILVAVDLRPAIVSVGPLLPLIREQFSLTNGEASLLTTIPAVLMGLLAFPAPWLAHRFGRDRVILLSLAILLVATVLRSFSGSAPGLMVSTAGVGAGIAVAGALIPGFVKQSQPKRASLLMGIYAMSLGLGSTVAAALAHPLALFGDGWRFGSGVFALPCLTAIAAWLLVARTRRQSSLEDSSTTTPTRHSMPVQNSTAWLVALYSSLNNFLFFGFVSWAAPMFREYGMSDAAAGLVLASFTGAFMIGNPLGALMTKSEDRRLVIGFFSALALAGTVAEALSPGLLPFVFIPLIAFGVGGSFTLSMILPLDNAANAQEANSWTGFVMGIGYLAGSFGPLSIGVLRDNTGSFEAPSWVLAGAGLLMLALSPFLQPHHRRSAKRELV